jgi:hypothetical protein
VKHHAAAQPRSDRLLEEPKAAEVLRPRCCAGLDLDADEIAAPGLEYDVHLEARGGTKVVKPGSRGGVRCEPQQLGGDERLQRRASCRWAGRQPIGVEPKEVDEQPRVREVELGGSDQPRRETEHQVERREEQASRNPEVPLPSSHCASGQRVRTSMRPARLSAPLGRARTLAEPVRMKRPARLPRSIARLIGRSSSGARWISSRTARSPSPSTKP